MSNYWSTLRQRKISRRTMLGASAKAGVGAAGLALVGCGDDDTADAGTAAAERAAEAAEEAAAAAVAAGEARAAETEAAADAAAEAAAAASEASAAASQAADAADAAAALAAEAAESEDAANAAAAAEAAAAAAADAAAAASAAGDEAAAAVAAAASEAAEAAAQAARDAAAAVEAGTATAEAAQAAIDEAAEAAAAAAAAAGEASAAAGEAAATAQQTAEAAAETVAAAVAAAEEAADAAREAAESAAMAETEDQPMSGAPMGGALRRGNTSTPNFNRLGLNTAGNNTGFNQDGSIYERIARVGASGLTRQDEVGPNFHRATEFDYAIQPVLATGWETPDDVTWVINSRTDPVWHTGRSFDASDIAWTLTEIQDENAGGGGSPMHLMAQNIDSVETIDATSLRMALTKPTGYIETVLEQTNIVDRETYDQRIEEAVVVGTGPYQFTNYDPNRGWDQIPHPDFASANPHSVYSGGQPLLDKIEHTLFADTNAMGIALEAGEIDTHRGVPIGIPEVEARMLADEDFFKVSGYGLGGRVLRFRADSEPFRNKLARQAVLMLADGPRIQRDFFGLFDVAGRMPWQPGSPAFVAELDPHPMAVDPEGTRAEAGRLLEAAGFSGGEVLKMDMLPERLDAPATAQLLQQEVAAFGIETEITPREYTEMIALQNTGTFNHMIIGFGNWVRPGSPAVTVLFADHYDGRMNAPVDENVPLLERPGIADEPEWTSMVQAAIDGAWDDWQAWNEKYLDVAWGNCLVRQYALLSENSARAGLTHPDDAYGWAYAPGYHIPA